MRHATLQQGSCYAVYSVSFGAKCWADHPIANHWDERLTICYESKKMKLARTASMYLLLAMRIANLLIRTERMLIYHLCVIRESESHHCSISWYEMVQYNITIIIMIIIFAALHHYIEANRHVQPIIIIIIITWVVGVRGSRARSKQLSGSAITHTHTHNVQW